MDENKVKVHVGLFGFFLSEVDDFYVSYSMKVLVNKTLAYDKIMS